MTAIGHIIDILVRQRHRLCMSQDHLAQILNIKKVELKAAEEKRRVPSLTLINEWADALDLYVQVIVVPADRRRANGP